MNEEHFVVECNNARNCFLRFSEKWIRKLGSWQQYSHILKISYRDKHAYFSWNSKPELYQSDSVVGISSFYAKNLEIIDGEQVTISTTTHAPAVNKMFVSTFSEEDWEILLENMDSVQSTLLNQVLVVWPGQAIVVWISKYICINICVDLLEPSHDVGLLEAFTEVIVNSSYFIERNETLRVGSEFSNVNSNKDTELQCSNSEEIGIESFLWNSIKYILGVPSKTTYSKSIDHSVSKELPRLMSNHEHYYKWSQRTLRLHLLNLNLQEKVKEIGSPFLQPFAVFVHKNFLFNMNQLEKFHMICKLFVRSESSQSTETLQTEEENNTSILYVQVYIIEDIYNSLTSDEQKYITETPAFADQCYIFISDTVAKILHAFPGNRGTLEVESAVNPEKLKEICLCALEKWDETDEELTNLFRMCVINSASKYKILINSHTLFPIQTTTGKKVVYVKLYPLAIKHVLLNVNEAKCCKITVDHSIINVSNTLDTVEVSSLQEECFGHLKSLLQDGLTCLEVSLKFQECNRNYKHIHSNLNPENILITGKCGSGKSYLAHLLCRDLRNFPYFVYCTAVACKQLKEKSIESIHKTLKCSLTKCIENQPSIIILDDLDYIASISEEEISQEGMYFLRVSETIVSLLDEYQDGNHIAVIATVSSLTKLHKSLSSPRGKHVFKTILEIPELSKIYRNEILKNLISRKLEQFYSECRDLDLSSISLRTEGYVLQDLSDLVDRAIFEALKCSESSEELCLQLCHFEEALNKTKPLSVIGVNLYKESSTKWNDIGGLEEPKQILLELLQWPALYPDLYQQNPLRTQSGLLLYGAPGTGKTLLASAVANECKINFIQVKGPEVLSKYIGASEEAVRNLFKKAEGAKPCILFFDEFDSLAPRRGRDNTGVTDRVVNQLLTQLDGVEQLQGVWVIAASSRPDLIDPALLRPGRLDQSILCPFPRMDDRISILKALSGKLHLADNVEFTEIAKVTEGFTGADLQAILYTAQLTAIEEVLGSVQTSDLSTLVPCKDENVNPVITQNHLMAALKTTRPSLSREESLKYSRIYQKFSGSKVPGALTSEDLKHQKAILA